MIRDFLRRRSKGGGQTFEMPPQLRQLDEHWTDDRNFPDSFGGAAEYARKMARHPLSFFVQRLHNLGLRGHRILDAGCGTGTWSFGMRGYFDEVYGADYVGERTDLARHIASTWGLGGTDFREANVQELPYEDNFFDAVFCFGVIIVPQTSVESSIREFKRVVRPGGSIYLCLNARGWAHYLASSNDDGRRNLGLDGIYMAICKQFRAGRAQADEVVEEIRTYCGEEYVERFRAEQYSPRGRTYPNTYEPDEVEAVARDQGLERFRWSHEGGLREVSDPVDVSPLYAPSFEGRTSVWECLMELPAAQS